MKNFIKLFGIIVLVTLIITSMAGCGWNEVGPYKIEVRNNASQTIYCCIVDNVLASPTVSIASNSTKTIAESGGNGLNGEETDVSVYYDLSEFDPGAFGLHLKKHKDITAIYGKKVTVTITDADL